jgi:hypothetical protein
VLHGPVVDRVRARLAAQAVAVKPSVLDRLLRRA